LLVPHFGRGCGKLPALLPLPGGERKELKKIHPISLREELLHSFEVKTRKGWEPGQQKIAYLTWYGPPQKLKGKRKKVRKQKFKKQRRFRQIYLVSDRKFKAIRIDDELIYKIKGKGVRQFKLQRLFDWEPYEKINPILIYLNRVREWAHKSELTVGGFPLVPYVVISKKNLKARNPIKGLEEGDVIEGYFAAQVSFIKTFGLGQVWKGDRESDEIHCYIAFWTQTGWREYRNEMPRFYVKKMVIMKEDIGFEEEDYSTKAGRQAVLEYVFDIDKIFMRDATGQLIQAPLGIVGWGYGD